MIQHSLSKEQQKVVDAALGLPGRLAFYDGVLQDPAVLALIDWLRAKAGGSSGYGLRTRFLAQVAAQVTASGESLQLADDLTAWQAMFIDRILFDANAFTEAAERRGDGLPNGMLRLAGEDLRLLRCLYVAPTLLAQDLDPAGILLELGCDGLATKDLLKPLREPMARELAHKDDWDSLAPALARWHRTAGAGVFGRYVAFRWEPGFPDGELVPIPHPDLVSPDALFEYEKERTTVFRNTEKFIQGLPAQNVLLYGNRGTGKSATVKAALYAFASHGLRMIEVPRRALGSIPALLQTVQGRGLRIILFVDDLSFDQGDDAYKELKAVLEGTLEGRPENVLVYATSNRRHLVEQRHSDRRRPSDDDVHPWDGMEERLSLADRFGLTVIFPSPDQALYLTIVEQIAKRRGLNIPLEELRKRALEWTVWNDGRSPRAAERFVDHLESERHYRPLKGKESASNRRS